MAEARESRQGGWDSDEFPWQVLTRRAGLPLVERLERTFDTEQLASEYRAIETRYALRPHSNAKAPGYRVLALIAPGGDAHRDSPGPGRYEKTAALACAPYFERVLDSFECVKHRVRLMHLAPQRSVAWHYDRDATLDRGFVRLHLPILTSAAVHSQLGHVAYHFGAGELWYGDFSFPHRLANDGATPRVHLVIDLERNAFIDGLFGDAAQALTGRDGVRAECQRAWHNWIEAEAARAASPIRP